MKAAVNQTENQKQSRGWGRWWVCAAFVLILAAAAALYLPFAGNPLIFDDAPFFEANSIYARAGQIFTQYTRAFPYFTLAFMHVISSADLSWNRYFSLGLFGLILVALYFFLLRAFWRVGEQSAQNGSTQNNQTAPNKPSALHSPTAANAASKTSTPISHQLAALAVCFWVALNPVAVYAAGYLMQRSILFATLFAIVAACLYLRAQQTGRNADILSAALLAALSMMSKEHAVLLPLAFIALTPLAHDWTKATWQRAGAFALLTLPVSVWVTFHRGQDVIGTSYEIYSAQLLDQIHLPALFTFPGGNWVMSIATQAILFWKYLFLWFFPNPQWLSIDLRVDFAPLWTGWGLPLLALALVAFALAGWVWFKNHPKKNYSKSGCKHPLNTDVALSADALTTDVFTSEVIASNGASHFSSESLCSRLPDSLAKLAWTKAFACAVLFGLVLFAAEFSAVRVQEPFVLYRSFLWMPAYALIFGFLLLMIDAYWFSAKQRAKKSGCASEYEPGHLRYLGRKLFCLFIVLACAAQFPLAQDRLRSFSSEAALWEDALAKLPRPETPGADRIYYNLAGEAFKRKDFNEALRLSEAVVKQNPTAFQGYLGLGTSLTALQRIDEAEKAFAAADAHHPPAKFKGYIEFKRCILIEMRGGKHAQDDVLACIRRSAKMGYGGAKFRLQMMGLTEKAP